MDSVDRVTSYGSGSISPAPDMSNGVKSEFVAGVARNQDSLTLILKMRAILGAEDLKTIEKNAA